MSSSRGALVVTLFALAVGCGDDDGNTVVVELRTDFAPGAEFATVETSVGTGVPLTAAALTTDDFLAGRRVADLDGLAGPVSIDVRLVDTSGTEVASRRTSLTVSNDVGITVVITRACRGVTCPGPDDSARATECHAGACVEPECSVENPVACGGVGCTSDGDCPSPTAACATPRCSEGVCLVAGRDAECAADQRCDPDSGCVARVRMDAGGVDAGVDAGPPPIDYGPLTGGLAAEFCPLFERCLGIPSKAFGGGTCEERVRRDFEDRTLPLIQAAAARGTLTVDPSRFTDCVDSVRAAGCGVFVQRHLGLCPLAFEGQQSMGETCNTGSECRLEAWCDRSGGCPGACAPLKASGMPCAIEDECQSGLVCLMNRCAPPTRTGSPCTMLDECEPFNICDAVSRTCRRLDTVFVLPAGRTCDPTTAQLCNVGISCVDEMGVPTCRAPVGSGASCTYAIPDMCPDGEYCPAVFLGRPSSCRALPAAGEACLGDARVSVPGCAFDHACGPDMLCHPKGRLGDACTFDAQCWSIACVGGSCVVPLCLP